MKTVNQLLDRIDSLRIDAITPALAHVRQQLIDFKRQHPKGGLTFISNTDRVMQLIGQAALSPGQMQATPAPKPERQLITA